jgi:hypothetical protein
MPVSFAPAPPVRHSVVRPPPDRRRVRGAAEVRPRRSARGLRPSHRRSASAAPATQTRSKRPSCSVPTQRHRAFRLDAAPLWVATAIQHRAAWRGSLDALAHCFNAYARAASARRSRRSSTTRVRALRLVRAPRWCGCRRVARRVAGPSRRVAGWRGSGRASEPRRCRRRRTPARRVGRRARRPRVARSRLGRRGAPPPSGSARRACRAAAGSAARPPDRRCSPRRAARAGGPRAALRRGGRRAGGGAAGPRSGTATPGMWWTTARSASPPRRRSTASWVSSWRTWTTSCECARRRSRTAAGTNDDRALVNAARRRRRVPPRRSSSAASAPPSAASTRSTCGRRSAPARVERRGRCDRPTNAVPTSRSSAASCCETADCVLTPLTQPPPAATPLPQARASASGSSPTR